MARKPLPLTGESEKSIQAAIDDYLVLDGWRIIKTDLPHLRGLGVQEKGIPDRLYLRYGSPLKGVGAVWGQAMWIEHKRKKGSASAQQLAWHKQERAMGAVTLIAGVDFEPSPEGFADWYESSGLMRRNLRLAKRSKG